MVCATNQDLTRHIKTHATSVESRDTGRHAVRLTAGLVKHYSIGPSRGTEGVDPVASRKIKGLAHEARRQMPDKNRISMQPLRRTIRAQKIARSMQL